MAGTYLDPRPETPSAKRRAKRHERVVLLRFRDRQTYVAISERTGYSLRQVKALCKAWAKDHPTS